MRSFNDFHQQQVVQAAPQVDANGQPIQYQQPSVPAVPAAPSQVYVPQPGKF